MRKSPKKPWRQPSEKMAYTQDGTSLTDLLCFQLSSFLCRESLIQPRGSLLARMKLSFSRELGVSLPDAAGSTLYPIAFNILL